MVEGAIRHLPLTNAELFGREAELAWLDACWRDRAFVASIVAWGGVGKTSLVTKWLAGMRDDDWRGFERIFDWSFYRQGTNTGSSDTFFAKALAEFGDPDPLQGSPWDKGERLAKLVRQKRTLLVLDGVESMQYGPGEQEGQFKDPAVFDCTNAKRTSDMRGSQLRKEYFPISRGSTIMPVNMVAMGKTSSLDTGFSGPHYRLT